MCVCVYTYVLRNPFFVCMYYMCVRLRICTCMLRNPFYVCMYLYICVCVCVCMYVDVYVCAETHTNLLKRLKCVAEVVGIMCMYVCSRHAVYVWMQLVWRVCMPECPSLQIYVLWNHFMLLNIIAWNTNHTLFMIRTLYLPLIHTHIYIYIRREIIKSIKKAMTAQDFAFPMKLYTYTYTYVKT
jgi:hypothetical protein